jgi:hypothetical protein
MAGPKSDGVGMPFGRLPLRVMAGPKSDGVGMPFGWLPLRVMAGLVPAIHVLPFARTDVPQVVDARPEGGHDGERAGRTVREPD